MKLIRPQAVTDAVLVSSSVPEPDTGEVAWNPATAYVVDNVVYLAANHTRYLRLVNGTTATSPDLDLVNWIDIGPTNRWKMFDASVQSQTARTDAIDISLQLADRADSLVLLNLSAASVAVTMTDAIDGVVFDQTFNLVSASGITDWYAYFYEPIVRATDLVVAGLPPYASALLDVVMAASGETVLCGVLVVGLSRRLGDTQWGANVGIIDYSVKQADAFGNLTPIKRAYSRRASFNLFLDPGVVDEVVNLLANYRAEPIVYIGDDAYASTAVYGFYREFSVEIAYPTRSLCSLEIEGLT